MKERPWRQAEKDILADWAARGGSLQDLSERLDRDPSEIIMEAGRVSYRVTRKLPDQHWIVRTAAEPEKPDDPSPVPK